MGLPARVEQKDTADQHTSSYNERCDTSWQGAFIEPYRGRSAWWEQAATSTASTAVCRVPAMPALGRCLISGLIVFMTVAVLIQALLYPEGHPDPFTFPDHKPRPALTDAHPNRRTKQAAGCNGHHAVLPVTKTRWRLGSSPIPRPTRSRVRQYSPDLSSSTRSFFPCLPPTYIHSPSNVDLLILVSRFYDKVIGRISPSM
jgi:hypothetical protein